MTEVSKTFRTEYQGTFPKEDPKTNIMLALYVRYTCEAEDFDTTLPHVKIDGVARVHPNARRTSTQQAARLWDDMVRDARKFGLTPDFTRIKQELTLEKARHLREWAMDILDGAHNDREYTGGRVRIADLHAE